MALDKLVDSAQLDADLTSVADAIRARTGGSGQLVFPTGFVSAIGTISGGTNYGVANINSLAEMFYALENKTFSTGTVTLASYFPVNTESVFCDTGYSDNLRGIAIFSESSPAAGSTSYDTYEALGFFGVASSAGVDQSISGVSSFTKARGYITDKFYNGDYISCRINSGKIYITPTRATTTNTYFHPGHTYRWIAWPYVE